MFSFYTHFPQFDDMKAIFVFVGLILFSVTGFAQTAESSTIPADLHFVPQRVLSYTPGVNEKVTHLFTPQKNTLAFATGFLLQGLKFSSPIDEFHAFAPFDARGFEPRSFSEYSLDVQLHYPLLQSHSDSHVW